MKVRRKKKREERGTLIKAKRRLDKQREDTRERLAKGEGDVKVNVETDKQNGMKVRRKNRETRLKNGSIMREARRKQRGGTSKRGEGANKKKEERRKKDTNENERKMRKAKRRNHTAMDDRERLGRAQA